MTLKPDRLGRTPLHYAACDGKNDLVKTLIQSGADVNVTDRNGMTPLHFAAQRLHVTIASLLIDAGAAVEVQDINGNTPLSYAVLWSKGRGELIMFLRQKGANPHAANKHGVTPLDLAKTIANYDVVQYFADLV